MMNSSGCESILERENNDHSEDMRRSNEENQEEDKCSHWSSSLSSIDMNDNYLFSNEYLDRFDFMGNMNTENQTLKMHSIILAEENTALLA